jgi:hypothetical protein
LQPWPFTNDIDLEAYFSKGSDSSEEFEEKLVRAEGHFRAMLKERNIAGSKMAGFILTMFLSEDMISTHVLGKE